MLTPAFGFVISYGVAGLVALVVVLYIKLLIGS